jgi:hypothetical protein
MFIFPFFKIVYHKDSMKKGLRKDAKALFKSLGLAVFGIYSQD